MAKDRIRIPLQRVLLPQYGNRSAYRIILSLDVQTSRGTYVRLPFRLDTGSDFTTIAISEAQKFGIPFVTKTPVLPRTAAGRARRPSYLSSIGLLFPTLPDWRFQCDCSFSPYPINRCILSLNDLIPHFLFRFERASAIYPHGCLVLHLRRDHRGQPHP